MRGCKFIRGRGDFRVLVRSTVNRQRAVITVNRQFFGSDILNAVITIYFKCLSFLKVKSQIIFSEIPLKNWQFVITPDLLINLTEYPLLRGYYRYEITISRSLSDSLAVLVFTALYLFIFNRERSEGVEKARVREGRKSGNDSISDFWRSKFPATVCGNSPCNDRHRFLRG